MPSQQATTVPVLMEEVERTNTVVVRDVGQGVGALPRRDLFAIEVNRRETVILVENSGT